MAGESKTTTKHTEIKRWVESRGGRPASVAGTEREEDAGVLRIDFCDRNESLEEISWDSFFEKFEENDLAFLYQDRTANGGESRFFKFVHR